jgi:hypothetical protein
MNLTGSMKFQMAKWLIDLACLQRLTGLLMALVLSGCTIPFFGGYGEKGQTTEEFAHYVESVFKLQNSMTSQIMALADSDEKPANIDVLLQAEQVMQKKCEALNEYAARDSDGQSTGLLLQNRVAQSAKDCETSAKEAQALLQKSIKSESPVQNPH